MSFPSDKSLIERTDSDDSLGSVRSHVERYVKRSKSKKQPHLALLSQLYRFEGVGMRIPGDDNNLYYSSDLTSHYVFSRGKRIFLFISKSILNPSDALKRVIKEKFTILDPVSSPEMKGHLQELRKLAVTHTVADPFIRSFLNDGRLTIYMRDLQNPYVEIGEIGDQKLVVPLDVVVSASRSQLFPKAVLKYSGQQILCSAEDEYNVFTLYFSHILLDGLFYNDQ